MIRKRVIRRNKAAALLTFAGVMLLTVAQVWAYPIDFKDDAGHHITIDRRPTRVVSLVPSITEILFRIGAGDTVTGITHHNTYPPETSRVDIMGGFFSPSVERIKKAAPDVIFVSNLHQEVIEAFGKEKCRIITLRTESITDSFNDLLLLGNIFDREQQAAGLVEKIRSDLNFIKSKVAKIPDDKRKRVIRLMGRDRVMTPGEDSFQSELIRAAGGIPHGFGKKGNIVDVTLQEWQAFNPQVIYGCGGDSETAKAFFDQPGWMDVDAVKTGRIYYFPCDLTCRASTNTGYFVSWLASTIYPEEFSILENQIHPPKVFDDRPVQIELDYVKNARIAYSHIDDFVNKTLIIDFDRPLAVVSTLEGQRSGIQTVGNHYSPPQCWTLSHRNKLKSIQEQILEVIGKSESDSSLLFTGADMDNLSVQKETFKAMTVFALVTAGVRGNAVRMSADEGKYYEHGTINVIIMTNMELTPRAMTRIIISATEGKTAALQDMDIRSSYTPKRHPATGTGTDNMIVVQGAGIRTENAGGHSKLGELVARTVYKGVQEAVYKQNGLVTKRSVFHRLKERKISILGLISKDICDCIGSRSAFSAEVERTLLDPWAAGFVELSLALSDDYEKGLIQDLASYENYCHHVAEIIAGKTIDHLEPLAGGHDLPKVLALALDTVLNGVYHRLQ
jgi:ABC-type Fe3+-hydroxamate transport system substrate-binding protein/adenosylcobinamide amidohydrolase